VANREREGDSSAHSLTDLMAGVAAIFLLIAVVFILIAAKRGERAQSQVAEFEQLKKTTLDRLNSLRQAIRADDLLRDVVSVDDEARGRDPFLVVVVFNRRRLSFESAHCDLAAEHRQLIVDVAPRVLYHVCDVAAKPEQSRARISMTLEGHTDRRPFQAANRGCGIDRPELTARCAHNQQSPDCERIGFENNVRLSGARAQNVFFAMRTAVAEDARLSTCLERDFVVAGRGPVEPRDGLPWAALRTESEDAGNRRVLLKIRAQADFANVDGTPGGSSGGKN
jgi:flagellar motor protein MotB